MTPAGVRRPPTRRRIQLPRPRDYQAAILEHRARNKVLAAGRRWGKSTIGLLAALEGHGPRQANGRPRHEGALYGRQVWWVVPDYPTSGHARWRDLKRACRGVWTDKSEQEHRIGLPGGGAVQLRSADDPDSLRGDGLEGVVLDEAPLMAAETWSEALRAALADRQGWSLHLSTPKGRGNWWWPIYLRGVDDAELHRLLGELGDNDDPRMPGWASFRRPSRENPQLHVVDEDTGLTELEALAAELGPTLVAQELEAEFTVAGGDVIHEEWIARYSVRAGGRELVLHGPTPRVVPVAGLVRFATMDVAASTKTSADYSVIATWGMTGDRKLVLLEVQRFRAEAPDTELKLLACWHRHRHAYIAVERQSMGLSLIQYARRSGLPIRELDARGTGDKMSRALFLGARMAGGDVYFPTSASWLPEVEAELLGFPNAPHDDVVDALAYGALEVAGRPRDGLHSG